MDIKSFWKQVREVEQSIPVNAPVYIISIEDLHHGVCGGMVSETDRRLAAECCARRTHRLATKDEIASYKELMAKLAAESREADQRMRALQSNSAFPPEVIAFLVQSVQREATAAKQK